VDSTARHDFDIDAIFASRPRLTIWYVPTRLRQLCYQARSTHEAAAAANGSGAMIGIRAAAPPPAGEVAVGEAAANNYKERRWDGDRGRGRAGGRLVMKAALGRQRAGGAECRSLGGEG
jgi:hypothetical protein